MKIRMMMTMNAITPMTIPTIAPTAILLDAVNKIRLSADITSIDKSELTPGDVPFYSMLKAEIQAI